MIHPVNLVHLENLSNNLSYQLTMFRPLLALLFLMVPAYAQQDDRYRIGAGDVLDIRVYNRPQLSREAVRVEGNGIKTFPTM